MTTTTRTTLVLGITGGYGNLIARELSERGHTLRALVRDEARGTRATADFPAFVELIEGDVMDAEALARAAAGVDVIVHAVNPPYDRWHELLLPVTQAIADAAAATGATILFPGNVYAYAPGLDISEDTPVNPPTDKGELRVEAERILGEATQAGARLILLRGGDFFGTESTSSWMTEIMGKAVRSGGAISMPLDDDIRHAFCYLPDFVRTHVDLMELGDALPADARFHFAGHVVTGTELTAAIRRVLGDPSRTSRRIPWLAIRMLGWVQPVMRELHKMRYLWQQEVVMVEDRLRDALGHVPHTPLDEALAHQAARLRGEDAAQAAA